jgi:Kef-type K+ transport system membrane component KefB/Trk K+ transport system NAD-binding subunit
MEETISFVPLLIVVSLALLVPIILSRFQRVRLPIVVGEILAGILIGTSGFGWVTQHNLLLDLLAEFGFVFLFFLAGTEIDFSTFFKSSNREGDSPRRGPSQLKLAFFSYALTLLLAYVFGWWMVSSGYVSNAWMMALIIAPSSLGIIVAVLKEGSFSRTHIGQAILSTALVADFGTLLLFTISVAIFSRGLTLDILLIGLLFVAFFLVYRFGNLFFNHWEPVRRLIEELSTATAQIKVRAAFTLLLVFVVLAEILGVEVVLGAFLAGAMVSLLSKPSDKEALHQLEAVGYGFFIPIFFIMIGVDFNINTLLSSPSSGIFNIPLAVILVPLFVVVGVAVKLLPAMLFKLQFGWRDVFSIGTLLSTRLSLMVAEAAIVLTLGLFDDSINAAIILTAMILATFAPVIFNRIAIKPPQQAHPPLIITGAGELGIQVASQLQIAGETVVLFDPDETRAARAQQRGLTVLIACVDQADPITEKYLNSAKTLINTYEESELNYRICKMAKEIFNIEHVVTRVTNPGDLQKFAELGVATMNPVIDQAALLAMLARNPSAYALLTRSDTQNCVEEIIMENQYYVQVPLHTLDLPGGVLVVALRRNGDLIVPNGNTQLELFDHLTLAGPAEDVESACSIFAAASD